MPVICMVSPDGVDGFGQTCMVQTGCFREAFMRRHGFPSGSQTDGGEGGRANAQCAGRLSSKTKKPPRESIAWDYVLAEALQSSDNVNHLDDKRARRIGRMGWRSLILFADFLIVVFRHQD